MSGIQNRTDIVCSSCGKQIAYAPAWQTSCPQCGESLSKAVSATSISTNDSIAQVQEANSLTKRYKDAYLVARTTTWLGGLVKAIGVLSALLLVIVGFAFMSNGRLRDTMFAMGVVVVAFGVFVGILFYFIGVLVSAQGQILKASLDNAVNSSPFLTRKVKYAILLSHKSI